MLTILKMLHPFPPNSVIDIRTEFYNGYPWSLFFRMFWRAVVIQLSTALWGDITMTSHERLVVSNHRSLSTVCLTAYAGPHQRNIYVLITGPLWGELTGEFPAQRVSNAEKDSIWWRHCDRSLYLAIHFLYVIYCFSVNTSAKKLLNGFDYKTLTDFPKCQQLCPRLFMKRPSPPREPSNTNHRPCSLAFDPCGLGLPIPGFSLGNLQWRWYLNQHGWWMG